MKKLVLLYILFAICSSGFSQVSNVQIRNTILKETSANPDIIGSPLLMEEWVVGEIEDAQGNRFSNLILNYNICENQLLLNAKTGITIVDERLYPKVMLYQVSDFFDTLKTELRYLKEKVGKGSEGYEMLLFENEELAFYKNLKCEFHNNTVEQFGTAKVVKEYVRNDTYLLSRQENDQWTEVKSYKDFYDIWDKDAVKKIIQKYDISPRTESGMIQLLSRISSDLKS